MTQNDSSRRSFLKKTVTVAAAAVVAPTLLTRKASGIVPPTTTLAPASERLRLACIGIGNRGSDIINDHYNTGLCDIVALCDVDLGAKHTVGNLKKFPNAKQFQDFRQMFDKMGKEIDAVTVGIPDFAHFPATMLAMSLGKHVYCEKPMARTFNEVELMIKGAKKHKVVTQMGNQGHSEANYFQFKTWVDAGIIKDVTAITAHMNGARRWHGWDVNIKSFPPKEPVPETLDWDTWLGTAQWHDYNHDYHLGQWRCWYDFGMGALGDWGAHILDTAHQFLKLGLPYEVDPVKLEGHNKFFFPQASTLKFRFAARENMPPLDITWYDGVNNIPAVPAGYGVSKLDPNIPPPSNGQIQPAALNPGKIIYSKDLIFKGGSHGSTLTIIPPEKAKEMESKLPEVPKSPSNHATNFLKSIKGEEQARSSFDIAGPLSQVFNLGVIAQWLNTKIEFDPVKKKITNNKLANELLVGTKPRKEWKEFYKI
ncbi:MAG: Gfo/Idh/MocA family oxidoreductase [Bacteroidales bacterium]|jgi:predicted dehydrogenase|nr:Gfo/Idh/MocA family oxidoreductase [Bacteroidales bacterium]